MPIDTISPPFNSLDLTCSGSAEVHVIIRQGTTNDATISYEKTNGRDTYFAESKLDFDVENSKLTARFITPTFTSFNLFGFGNELSVQLVVSLPSDIEDFAFQGNRGRIVLEGPNFGGNVNVKNNVGDVRISPSLSSKSINIETNTGSIKALGSLSAQSIQLNSKVGAIHTQSLTADAVEINTNTGSIHADQVTVTQDVTLKSNVGAVEINNVSANSLVVNSRTGSISFSKAHISNQVSLTNSTGSIKGWFQGYSSLNTVTGTGSAIVTLIPGASTSKTSIKTELGSIDAIVKGFRGRFSANTDLGKVYVSSEENGEFGQDKSSLSGVVGEDVGALMDFKTGNGKVQISFLPELNTKEHSSAPAPAPPTRSRTVDLTLSGSAYFDVIVRKGAQPENGVQVRAVRTAGLHHYFLETKISIDSHEGKSAIRVTTPTFSNFAIGGWGDTLYLKVFITLNRDIEEFTCQGDLLQLSFEAGVHVSRVVDVKSRSGDVKIVSALNVETLALACGTGNITIENTVTTSKDITLQAKNGIILAARPLDARNLRVIAGTGPILLDNITAAEEVNLESKAGGIEALEIKSNSFTASTDTNVATGALTGILSFSKVTTLNAVILQTNTGGISGQFVGYETLIGSAKFGAINVTLTPGSGGSSTSLSTEFGAVDAVVKDYKGKFDAKGSTISIRGAGDGLDGNHQGIIHGIIRENHEKSNANISLRTMNGNVDVKFIQLSPTASSEPTFVAPPSYDEQA